MRCVSNYTGIDNDFLLVALRRHRTFLFVLRIQSHFPLLIYHPYPMFKSRAKPDQIYEIYDLQQTAFDVRSVAFPGRMIA